MRDAQTSRGRPWPLTLLTGFGLAALLALACSPPGEASTLPKDNLATAPTTAPADASAVRLASDLFVSVGEQHRIDGFGELIEALYVTGPPALAVSDDAVVAEAGGISCLQFRYREVEQENAIQAQRVMARPAMTAEIPAALSPTFISLSSGTPSFFASVSSVPPARTARIAPSVFLISVNVCSFLGLPFFTI